MLTRMSRSPNVSIAVLTSRWAPSQSATSSPLTTASPPMALISSTTCCGRRDVGAGAVVGAAEVVDDDLRAFAGEQQRVLAADAAARAGDDCDPAVKRSHAVLLQT